MARGFYALDLLIFVPLAGNPLMVALDGDGPKDAAMRGIAPGFNLSQTDFVREATNGVNTAAVRTVLPPASFLSPETTDSLADWRVANPPLRQSPHHASQLGVKRTGLGRRDHARSGRCLTPLRRPG